MNRNEHQSKFPDNQSTNLHKFSEKTGQTYKDSPGSSSTFINTSGSSSRELQERRQKESSFKGFNDLADSFSIKCLKCNDLGLIWTDKEPTICECKANEPIIVARLRQQIDDLQRPAA